VNTDQSNLDTNGQSASQTNDAAQSASIDQKLLCIVGPIAALTLVSLPLLLTWSTLPDPMNISWTASGEPSNPTSPVDFLGYNLAVGVVCSVLFVVGGLKKLPTAMLNATAILVAAILAPMFATIALQVSLANRGVSDWTEASDPSSWWIVASIAAAALGAVAISAPARRLFKLEPVDTLNAPTAGLAMEQGRSFFLPIGGLAVFLGFVFIVFSRVNVSVDRRGLTVTYGFLPWPKNRIKLDSVSSAEAIDVRPMEHGGWGYRGSRKLLGRAAVVVRGGQGIRVSLTDGTDFIVTVDNADQGAGVLNDLRAGV